MMISRKRNSHALFHKQQGDSDVSRTRGGMFTSVGCDVCMSGMGEPIRRWASQGFWVVTRKPLFPPGGSGAHSTVSVRKGIPREMLPLQDKSVEEISQRYFWELGRGWGARGDGGMDCKLQAVRVFCLVTL